MRGRTCGAAEEVPYTAGEELAVEVNVRLRLLLNGGRVEQDGQQRDNGGDDDVGELLRVEDGAPQDVPVELARVAFACQWVPCVTRAVDGLVIEAVLLQQHGVRGIPGAPRHQIWH